MSDYKILEEARNFLEQKEFEEAISFLNKKVEEYNLEASNGLFIKVLQLLGEAYLDKAENIKVISIEERHKVHELLLKAKTYFKQSHALSKKNGDDVNTYLSISLLGLAYFSLGKNYFYTSPKYAHKFLDIAIAYFFKRNDSKSHYNNKEAKIRTFTFIGKAFSLKARIICENKDNEKFISESLNYFGLANEILNELSDTEGNKDEKYILYQSLQDGLLYTPIGLNIEKKKERIRLILFSKNFNETLVEIICSILSVLWVTPEELRTKPLAHYTNAHVCDILFGFNSETPINPIRINSATYMNDPFEGKCLLDLLNRQELDIENKTDFSTINAFFACFSSRVNDLNQFRLYGKEDGIEASGCCLVFNKNGKWLKEVDIKSAYSTLSFDDSVEFNKKQIVKNENLPLYQVAYIAFKDEYFNEDKYDFVINNTFGVHLKPLDSDKEWHQIRIKKFNESLEQLVGYFSNKTSLSLEEEKALEYIRYLFKDYAFRDEEEFRILRIEEIGSEHLEYCSLTNSIFIPYGDVSGMVDEVILGTNYEKTSKKRKIEVFRHLMSKSLPHIKVSHSSLPIVANT